MSRLNWFGCFLMPFMVSSLVFEASWAASGLRHTPDKGKSYAYQVEMVVDGLNGKDTHKGQMTLKADRTTDEQITFSLTSKVGSYQHRGVRFSVSPVGEIQSIDGDASIPYFLGDLPFLLVDQLSSEGKDTWAWEEKVTLSTSSSTSTALPRGIGFTQSSRYGRTPFSQRRPGSRGIYGGTKSISTLATESMKYKLEADDGGLIKIVRTYALKSKPDPDGRTYEITGGGDWVFNRNEGMPESLRMKRKIMVNSDKITVRVPVELTMKRVSQEELDRRAAETKAKIAKHEKERSAPLTGEERQQLIADLRSKDRSRVHRALGKLLGKKPEKPDAEIVAAIEQAIRDNASMRHLASRVKLAYSPPDVVRRIKLNDDYRGRGTVESTGRTVNDDTELFVGQIVQFRRSPSPFWFAGVVKEFLDNGNLLIAENGPFNKVREVARKDIQLAPEEVDQPEAKKEKKVVRVWKDATETHEISAELVGYDSGQVKLKKKSGKVVTIDESKLSKADQEFLQRYAKQQEAKASVPNPFE